MLNLLDSMIKTQISVNESSDGTNFSSATISKGVIKLRNDKISFSV